MKKEKSCGAVVYQIREGRVLFLAEHMIQGHTSIPKGHVEGQETEEETALREIREETNLEADLDTRFRHVITYSPREGVEKDVVFFVARAREGKMVNQECEVSALEWLPREEMLRALTFESDREPLRRAADYLENQGIR